MQAGINNSSYSHGLVGIRTQDSSKDFAQPLVIAYYNVDYKKNVKGIIMFAQAIMVMMQMLVFVISWVQKSLVANVY